MLLHVCYDCDREFVDAVAVWQHCRDLGHDQAWECSKCEYMFASEDDLDEHYEACGQEYFCEHCSDGRTFHSNEALNQHREAKHVHTCQDCSKTFTTPHGMESHNSVCHNLTCAECGQFYKHKSQFDQHLLVPGHAAAIRQYEANSKRSSSTSSQETFFDCDVCGGKFDTMVVLQDHKIKWHRIRCDHCFGTFFESVTAFKKHQKEVHLIQCTTCEEPFFLGEFVGEPSGHCPKCDTKAEGGSVDLSGLGGTSDHDISIISTAQSKAVPPSSTRSTLSPEKVDATGFKRLKHCSAEVSAIYKCDACVTTFENDEDLQTHIKHSPFHEPRVLACYECSLTFQDQIALLQHLKSRPHKTRWVLSIL